MMSRQSSHWSILATVALGVLAQFAVTPGALARQDVIAGFGPICGPVNSEPTVIHTDKGTRKIAASVTTTVLAKKIMGLQQVRHFGLFRMFNPDGSVAWKRPLQTTSQAIATVVPGDPPFFYISETLNIPDRQASPVVAFPFQCLGISAPWSGGMQYIAVALGTSAQSGGSVPNVQSDGPSLQSADAAATEAVVVGKDKTVVNVWILNIDTGKVHRWIGPRPKPGWYILPTSSGIYDYDDDGDAELVIVRAKFIGEDRYDYMYEVYNISTGIRESTSMTNQNNKVVYQ